MDAFHSTFYNPDMKLYAISSDMKGRAAIWVQAIYWDIRDARLDGILSEIAVIMNTVFADRRVDDQLDLAVCDQVDNVGS